MIRASLEFFIEGVTAAGEITLADVRRLQRNILPDGPDNRDEVDVLLALDRAIGKKHCTWSAYAVTSIVDYVVWTARPTGYVDRDAATWLVATLAAGRGPTPVAEAIAFEIAREAERSDEALLAFVLKSATHHMQDNSSEFGATS